MNREPRNFPPPPNGWFAVATSKDLRRGQVVPVRAFGRDLVLFRTERGAASVLDRYCPHLGASLAQGGEVCGEEIRCPFHGWRFDASGACKSAGHANRIPPRARVRGWPTAEANGLVFVYHHAEGADPPAPPRSFEHFSPGPFTRVGESTFTLKSHPQEIAENAFDASHFSFVHRTTYPDVDLIDEGGEFGVLLNPKLLVGRWVVPMDSSVDIRLYELGLIRVNVKVAPLVNLFVYSYATPIEADEILMRNIWVAEGGRGPLKPARLAASWLAGLEGVRQSKQDRPIWNTKVHRPQPVLAENDRLIGTFRKWAKQFYSEGASAS